MKYSEAMLKGFKKVGGRQCKNELSRNERGRVLVDGFAPHSVCVNGAVLLAVEGRAGWGVEGERVITDGGNGFYSAWEVDPVDLNNEGMPWEHIYGMAVAAGL